MRAGTKRAAVAAMGWALVGSVLSASAAAQTASEGSRGRSEVVSGLAQMTLRAERPPEEPDALRIEIAGGEPFEHVALCVQGPCGRVLQPIALDAAGSWQQAWSGIELDAGVEVGVLRSAAGAPKLGGAVRVAARPAANGSGLHQGYVVVCEILKDPVHVSDSNGEWIEIVNTSHNPVDIEGWTLSDLGSNKHKLSNGGLGIVLQPGQLFVLGNQLDPLLNGGVHVNYKYSSFSLSNGADEVILTDAQGELQDIVAYDDGVLWPDTPGVALNLSLGAFSTGQNDDPASWCDAAQPIGPTNPDLGTPGGQNALCP